MSCSPANLAVRDLIMLEILTGTAQPGTPQVQHRSANVLTLRQTFLVNLLHGLHARPCALLVKRLQRFQANVEVEANGERASGHSIMSLMALAASYGSEVTFTITGADAAEAMAVVTRLFETHFEEAYRGSASMHTPLAVESKGRPSGFAPKP